MFGVFAVDFVLAVILLLFLIWLYKKSNRSENLDRLLDGSTDVVKDYENTLNRAEKMVKDTEKEEERLKEKKEKVKSIIS